MLLSSTYSSRPLLATSLRITRSSYYEPEPENATPSDYYSEEERQIRKTQREIESAISDLKEFLDISPSVVDVPGAPAVSLTASISNEEAHAILDLLDKQAQQIDHIEGKLRDSQLNFSNVQGVQLTSQPICFPSNEQVLQFMRCFEQCNPALLVNYQDIVDFISSRQFTDSIGVERTAEDLRTTYFKSWTPQFEIRFLNTLKIKFGDYKGARRAGALALKQFESDDGEMSVYQLWLCCVALWWICGGQLVIGRGLCIGKDTAYSM